LDLSHLSHYPKVTLVSQLLKKFPFDGIISIPDKCKNIRSHFNITNNITFNINTNKPEQDDLDSKDIEELKNKLTDKDLNELLLEKDTSSTIKVSEVIDLYISVNKLYLKPRERGLLKESFSNKLGIPINRSRIFWWDNLK
jgi:hypothetical protein